MTDIADFEQYVMVSFYNAIPTLDTANDWFTWDQKVNDFIRISAVADDGINPPVEEEAAQQWTHRQKFYSAMITAKMTDQAAQRIHALDITRVQPLLKAVKDNFKPALRTFAVTRNSDNRTVNPSLDGTTCRIEMYNVPYCSFCQKPYHVEPECFKKNPSLKIEGKYGKEHKEGPVNHKRIRASRRKSGPVSTQVILESRKLVGRPIGLMFCCRHKIHYS